MEIGDRSPEPTTTVSVGSVQEQPDVSNSQQPQPEAKSQQIDVETAERVENVPNTEFLGSVWRTEELPPPNSRFLISLQADSSDSKVLEFLGEVKEQVAKRKSSEKTESSEVERGKSLFLPGLTNFSNAENSTKD